MKPIHSTTLVVLTAVTEQGGPCRQPETGGAAIGVGSPKMDHH
jgi:hypothetical protein